jgi:putative iron-regulated protein
MRVRRSRFIGVVLMLVPGLLGVFSVAGCGGQGAASASEVITHYADGVHASYAASLSSAEEMSAAIDAFVAGASDQTLQDAKDAWLAARDDYGQTEVFRFYGGPIDNEETGKEGQINAWPLDEAYVDYVDGDPTAGIIADAASHPSLDASSLAELNEKGGETNISTGWHAIEFLLWGQDLSEDGPGSRPASDYTTAPNAERRADYLTTVTGLLISDLGELVAAWRPDAESNYRTEFLSLDDEEGLRRIMTGMGELSRGELAGERLNVAYSERSQEDEHSCFSDNTTSDIVANAKGIQMVYTGEYPGLSGPGLGELIAGEDDDLDTRLSEQLNTSVSKAGAIPAPFDQHIRTGVPDTDPGRAAILDTILALEDQAESIVDAAAALDIQVNLS